MKKQKVKEIIELDEDDDCRYLKNNNFNNVLKPNYQNHYDDDAYLLQIDEKNLKTNRQNVNQQKRDFKSENKENNQIDSSDEFDAFLNDFQTEPKKKVEEFTKVSTLNDSTFLNFCCLKNPPTDNTALSTCNHLVNL